MRGVGPAELDFSAGRELLEAEIAHLRASSVLQFPTPMRGSDWIEKYGRIAAEASAEPGPVVLWGYQREPADSICGNEFDQVTVIKGKRAVVCPCCTSRVRHRCVRSLAASSRVGKG